MSRASTPALTCVASPDSAHSTLGGRSAQPPMTTGGYAVVIETSGWLGGPRPGAAFAHTQTGCFAEALRPLKGEDT